jgi:hypothetical protein
VGRFEEIRFLEIEVLRRVARNGDGDRLSVEMEL